MLGAREKLTLAANQPGPHALFSALDDYEAKLQRLEAHVEQLEINAVDVVESLCPGF
jgi:exonuclease VII small subunit